jgi:peptidoglycan L-alanyl-D-glutamate endopeptidase CwlK
MSLVLKKKESEKINEMNAESIMRINTLNPQLVPQATKVFNECLRVNIPIYVVFGVRTPKEQDFMFRFGRTIPGRVITQHRGGFSAHNYGLALDFCLRFNSSILSWTEVLDRPYWKGKWVKVIELFKQEGWDNKINNPSFEPGHVENLMGHTIGELYEQTKNRHNWDQDL